MGKMQTDIAQYYADRAKEYDKVYEMEGLRTAIAGLVAILCEVLAGKTVLEVACGTGYTTKDVAGAAKGILATDINNEVLDIARARLKDTENVELLRDDAFSLSRVSETFEAG